MRNVFGAALSLATLVGVVPALAADLGAGVVEASPSTWSSFYFGAQTASAMGDNTLTFSDTLVWNGSGTKGVGSGALAGFDLDLGNGWVAGAEGSAATLGLKSHAELQLANLIGGEFETFADWTARLSGRVGYLVSPDTLLFGSAGLASYHGGTRYSVLGGPEDQQSDYFAVMASVCVGIEARIAPRWRIRGEYVSDFFPEVDWQQWKQLQVQGHVGTAKASLLYTVGDDHVPEAFTGDASRWQSLYLGVSGSETLSVSNLIFEPGNVHFSTDGAGAGGVTGTVQVGGNLVLGDTFVVGGELTTSVSTSEASQSLIQDSGTRSVHEGNKHWAEARVRAGILVTPETMAYGVLGYTRAHGELWFEGPDMPNYSAEFDRNGVVSGAGLETLVGDNLSVRVEYSRTQYDAVPFFAPIDLMRVLQDQQSASLGLNYHLR